MRDQGIGNSELARRLDVNERVVRRMLDPGHETKAENIQAALAVLGKRLTWKWLMRPGRRARRGGALRFRISSRLPEAIVQACNPPHPHGPRGLDFMRWRWHV